MPLPCHATFKSGIRNTSVADLFILAVEIVQFQRENHNHAHKQTRTTSDLVQALSLPLKRTVAPSSLSATEANWLQLSVHC